jgi:hypothetical protein
MLSTPSTAPSAAAREKLFRTPARKAFLAGHWRLRFSAEVQ